mgnify:CR=1 FL=1
MPVFDTLHRFKSIQRINYAGRKHPPAISQVQALTYINFFGKIGLHLCPCHKFSFPPTNLVSVWTCFLLLILFICFATASANYGNSFKFSKPLNCVMWFEKRDRSVILVQFSSPSIFSIKLKERSSHLRFTSWFKPLILVMILLSSYSLVSFSIPFRLSISTMSNLYQL